jgi:LPS-assembly lipoprotein
VPSLLRRLARFILNFIIIGGLAFTLSGCGFTLQTKAIIPFQTIYIAGSPSADLRYHLESTIPIFTSAKITGNPQQADLVLMIERDEVNSSILAYSATGQITAFALNNLVGFYAYAADGQSVLTERNVYVVRDMNFTVSTVLASEIQQQQMVASMKEELAMQIVRQLMALQF